MRLEKILAICVNHSDMSTEKITVYSFRRCPFAMRVRMALHPDDPPVPTIPQVEISCRRIFGVAMCDAIIPPERSA